MLAIRKLISNIVYYSGLNYIFWKLKNKHILILAYHRVLNLDDRFKLDPTLVSASVSNFKKQMEYLSRNYNVISIDQFYSKIGSPKKNSVIITFDDGYIDNYTNAYPILKKYNLPATIYLSTNAVDNKEILWWDKVSFMIKNTKESSLILPGHVNYDLKNKGKALRRIARDLKELKEEKKLMLIADMEKILKVKVKRAKNLFLSWNQINEMKKNNISFGAHTVSHPILTNISSKKAEMEIVNSKKLIEKKIKSKVIHFSYPNGHVSDFNNHIISILKKNNFNTSVTYIPGWNKKSTNPYKLNRIFVRYEDDMILFKNKLIGLDIIFGKIYRFFVKNKRKK